MDAMGICICVCFSSKLATSKGWRFFISHDRLQENQRFLINLSTFKPPKAEGAAEPNHNHCFFRAQFGKKHVLRCSQNKTPRKMRVIVVPLLFPLTLKTGGLEIQKNLTQKTESFTPLFWRVQSLILRLKLCVFLLPIGFMQLWHIYRYMNAWFLCYHLT